MAKPNKTTVQVEKLKDRSGLQSTVNSGGLYSYDEARPAYVERPDSLRSNPWMQLSSSLQEFDAPLKEFTKKRQEEQMEQGIAQGSDIFSQGGTDPTTGNKLAWKDFVQNNPEHVGKNPWLRTGYERARLQSLALDFKAQAQNAYTENGLVNEQDMNKVGQFFDQFEKQFRAEHGLQDYPDKVTLGETFTKSAYEVKNSIFNRHVNDMEKQNLARTREQYTILFSKDLSGILDDPDVNLSSPDAVEQMVIPRLLESIEKNSREAALNGLPETEVQDMVFKALAAEASERGWDGGGDDILELMGDLDFGSGRLGDVPAVKDWIATTETRFTNQQKADEAEADRQREKALRENEKNAVRTAVRLAREGKIVTPDMLVEMGVDEYNLSSALGKANAVRQSLDHANQIIWTDGLMAEFGRDRLRAERREMTDSEIVAAYGRYGFKADKLLNSHQNAIDSEDTKFTSYKETGMNKIASILAKGANGETLDLANADTGNPAVQRAISAGNDFVDLFTVKIEEEKAKKDGPGEISDSKMNILYRKALEETLKNPDYEIYPKPDNVAENAGNNGSETPPPASQDPAVHQTLAEARSRPLFGSNAQWDEAIQEMETSADPLDSHIGRRLAELNITAVEDINTFLSAQRGYYSTYLAPGEGSAVDFSLPSLTVKDKAGIAAVGRILKKLNDRANAGNWTEINLGE